MIHVSLLGDDQDLDDRVIKQLWEENQDLRDQVYQLKSENPQTDEGKKCLNEADACETLFYLLFCLNAADKNAKVDDWINSFIALDLDRMIGTGASCFE